MPFKVGSNNRIGIRGLITAILIMLCIFSTLLTVFAFSEQSFVPSTTFNPDEPDEPDYQSNADPIDPDLITIELTLVTREKIKGIIHGAFIRADIFVYTQGTVAFKDMNFEIAPEEEWTINGSFMGHGYVKVIALVVDLVSGDLVVREFNSAGFHIKSDIEEDIWDYVEGKDNVFAYNLRPVSIGGRKTSGRGIKVVTTGGGHAGWFAGSAHGMNIGTGWFSDMCLTLESVVFIADKDIVTLTKKTRTYFVHEKEDDPNKRHYYFMSYQKASGACCSKYQMTDDGKYAGRTPDCKKTGEKFKTLTVAKNTTANWNKAVSKYVKTLKGDCWKQIGYTTLKREYTDDDGNVYDPRDKDNPSYPDTRGTIYIVTGVYPSMMSIKESQIPTIGKISNCYISYTVKGWELIGVGTARRGQEWSPTRSGQTRNPTISIVGGFTYAHSTGKLIKKYTGEGIPCYTDDMNDYMKAGYKCYGMPHCDEITKGGVTHTQPELLRITNQMKFFGKTMNFGFMSITGDGEGGAAFHFWGLMYALRYYVLLITLIIITLTPIVSIKLYTK